MHIKKGIISGIVAGLVLFFLDQIIDVVMEVTGAPLVPYYNASSVILGYSNTQGLILQNVILAIFLGILMGVTFSIFYSSIPKGGWMKGLIYGFLFYLISDVPSILRLNIFMPFPEGVMAHFLIKGLIEFLIVGIVLSKVYENTK